MAATNDAMAILTARYYGTLPGVVDDVRMPSFIDFQTLTTEAIAAGTRTPRPLIDTLGLRR